MNVAALEMFLARLYTDDGLRREFLARPEQAARQAGLDEEAVRSLASMDRAGLGLAAASYAAKRAGHGNRRRPPGLLRWMLIRVRRW